MKIIHKKYYNPKWVNDICYPCVVWWVESCSESKNHTLWKAIYSDDNINDVLSSIQSDDNFVKWLGWESLESFYNSGGLIP